MVNSEKLRTYWASLNKEKEKQRDFELIELGWQVFHVDYDMLGELKCS